ncbi:anti-phage ZorAB system protein ZorA [Arenicella xantha]|uniref:Uncharacterized protein n=1 Tax=Arenicella xantha TaxID=644221 RepID=A0A395JNU5_9GAMM|nr:anti-phage ZorAB system protein ZorA [Arenicella xantha]RBP52983.1 hypothetical protein DFR28_101367 [Arenicella xantha]
MNWFIDFTLSLLSGLRADFLSSADSITAWCEFLIIILFLVAILKVISGTFSGWTATNQYLNAIKDLDERNLVQTRQTIKRNLGEKYRSLWNEFDESLVLTGEEKNRLGNTIDAVHFFNMENIAPVFINSRFVKATPGLLTGIGVLGTFAGLWFGLKGINVGGGNAEELRGGINVMIAGASSAFFTSIWGVGASLLFSVIEKPCESVVRRQILKLRNKIDFLYPRVTSEESLASIDRTLTSSHIALKTLAEQIGDRMQEVMSEATDSMSNAIVEGLSGVAPVMEQLTNGARESSEKVLEALLEKFLEKVGNAGQAQQHLMQESSIALSSSIETVTRDLKNTVTAMSTDIARLSASQTSAIGSSASALTDTAAEVKSAIIEAGNHQVSTTLEATQGFNSASDSIASNMQKMSEKISNMMQLAEAREQARLQGTTDAITQVNQNQQVAVEQLLIVRESFNDLIKAHEAAALEMRVTIEKMREVSGDFSDTSGALKDASSHLGRDIKNATTLALEVVENSKEVSTLLASLPPAFERTSLSLSDTSSALGETVVDAKQGFDHVRESIKDYQESLIDHVKEIEEKMAELLNEYAASTSASVEKRMSEWNTQTETFTDNMLSAMNALQGVVDQMDRVTKSKN